MSNASKLGGCKSTDDVCACVRACVRVRAYVCVCARARNGEKCWSVLREKGDDCVCDA